MTISRWEKLHHVGCPVNLMMNKSKNELDFAVKIWRNFVVVPSDYAILLQVMRHGFTIGRLVTSQQTKAGLAKVNHQRLWFVGANLNPKNLFCMFFKSKGSVLIHCVDKGKAIDDNYYIENCLKPVVKEKWHKIASRQCSTPYSFRCYKLFNTRRYQYIAASTIFTWPCTMWLLAKWLHRT